MNVNLENNYSPEKGLHKSDFQIALDDLLVDFKLEIANDHTFSFESLKYISNKLEEIDTKFKEIETFDEKTNDKKIAELYQELYSLIKLVIYIGDADEEKSNMVAKFQIQLQNLAKVFALKNVGMSGMSNVQ